MWNWSASSGTNIDEIPSVKPEIKGKKLKQSRNRPGVAQSVPGGLSYKIFMTFGTWKWWGRQPYAPAGFTPRSVPGTHFH
jgi:hypothetical protein